MRKYSPSVARRVLWLLLMVVSLFIALATWLTTRTIGNVETIQQASDALELRSFRVGARLRSQVYRLSSVILRFEVTGVDSYRDQFETYSSELDNYLDEQRVLLDSDDEVLLAEQIRTRLDLLYEEARGMFGSRAGGRAPIERVESLKGQLDNVVELTYQLADSRRGEFRQLLADYRNASRRLERYIFLAVGALVVAAAAIAWLAYQAYMNPVRRELHEAQAIAQQKEELASVGALAGGIAHEIRNPITGIRARCFALAEMVDAGSPAAKQAKVIDEEVTRMERILNDFLDFARPQEPNVERCDIGELVAEVHAFHLAELESHGVEFRLDLPAGGGSIEADVDPGQIRQVLTNLIRNAGEAFSERDGGVVTLSLRAGDGVVLSVQDNGPGIDPAALGRVFEPFYSKKRGGTGLGLAISENIVEKHSGTIDVESTEGAGTVFKVVLPLPLVRS